MSSFFVVTVIMSSFLAVFLAAVLIMLLFRKNLISSYLVRRNGCCCVESVMMPSVKLVKNKWWHHDFVWVIMTSANCRVCMTSPFLVKGVNKGDIIPAEHSVIILCKITNNIFVSCRIGHDIITSCGFMTSSFHADYIMTSSLLVECHDIISCRKCHDVIISCECHDIIIYCGKSWHHHFLLNAMTSSVLVEYHYLGVECRDITISYGVFHDIIISCGMSWHHHFLCNIMESSLLGKCCDITNSCETCNEDIIPSKKSSDDVITSSSMSLPTSWWTSWFQQRWFLNCEAPTPTSKNERCP